MLIYTGKQSHCINNILYLIIEWFLKIFQKIEMFILSFSLPTSSMRPLSMELTCAERPRRKLTIQQKVKKFFLFKRTNKSRDNLLGLLE